MCVIFPCELLAIHWYSPLSVSEMLLKRKRRSYISLLIRDSDISPSFLSHDTLGVGLKKRKGKRVLTYGCFTVTYHSLHTHTDILISLTSYYAVQLSFYCVNYMCYAVYLFSILLTTLCNYFYLSIYTVQLSPAKGHALLSHLSFHGNILFLCIHFSIKLHTMSVFDNLFLQ